MTIIRTFLFTVMFVSWPTVVRAEAENEPNAGQRRARLPQRFDRDGNGQLDKNERAAARDAREKRRADGSGRRRGGKRDPEQRAKILEQFDADGNGQLDKNERAAARDAREKRRTDGSGRRRGGKRDPEQRAKILEQFDVDGNGQLDEEERTAARQARGRQSNDRNRGKRQRGQRHGKTGSLKGKNAGQLQAPRGRDRQSGKRLRRAGKRRQAGGPGAKRRKARKPPGR